MDPYHLIIANKELIKPAYGLIVMLICVFIVLKTNKMFAVSLHQGIRYFRNAFFFYGLAFFFRYLLGADIIYQYVPDFSYFVIKVFFEFFLIMAGFFLIYSLFYKRMEKPSDVYMSSLLSPRVFLFYAMAIIIVVVDHIFQTFFFMFLSQILIFSIATLITLMNLVDRGSQHKFLKFYFVAMLLSLAAWILNAILAVYLDWNVGLLMNVYIINLIIFLLFLYGVINVTKRGR